MPQVARIEGPKGACSLCLGIGESAATIIHRMKNLQDLEGDWVLVRKHASTPVRDDVIIHAGEYYLLPQKTWEKDLTIVDRSNLY